MHTVEHRNSNLFIKLFGDLNRASACAVVNAIKDQYTGTGNIFVNVEKVADVQPTATMEFRKRLANSALPAHKIYFIGKKGHEIGNGDFRVIIRPKRKCSGKCHVCPKKSTLSTIAVNT